MRIKLQYTHIFFILLVNYIKVVHSRIVYVVAHAEKPGDGRLDNDSNANVSSMDGLGKNEDGLGYTGMLRVPCMMNAFGPNAPYYRRPKRILTQKFMLQNNGNFIYDGLRGHHTSRRMYHETYALALSLGIDPDEELCCGGSMDDLVRYISALPPEDDPILIVNQHGVCDSFIRAYALTNDKPADFEFFNKEAEKVWTMKDGEFIEEWYVCCSAIPNNRCTTGTPAWANSYKFASTTQKPPITPNIRYPSYIYTPENIAAGTWSYPSTLRKRGLWSGEECFNEDLVKPFVNASSEFVKRDSDKTEDEKITVQLNQTQNNTDNTDNDDLNENLASSNYLYHYSSFFIVFLSLFVYIILF